MAQEANRSGLPGSSQDASRRPSSGLFGQLYEELHAQAQRYFRNERTDHTLQPTALVHEAYLRLAQASADWSDPVRFRAIAARVMRNVLTDYAVARNAEKRGGGKSPITLSADTPILGEPELDLERLNAALDKLAQFDERKARVVELRFFGGLTAEQSAEHLQVSLSTVEADWRMAKAWLRGELSRE
ncbi:RNA polymerase sigma factor [Phycisphaerae bacterium RAS1]|nr:RNA polymerase sigma factor [Phycisphaerae bacterium RAS1]